MTAGTMQEAYREGTRRLQEAGVPEGQTDAWYLLEYVTGISRGAWFADPARPLTGEQAEQYARLIRSRAERIPLQHLTGSQEFMGLPFAVDSRVLIPRQDTETLVELALEHLRSGETGERESSGRQGGEIRNSGIQGSEIRILDLCTGSGCILLSLLHYGSRILSGRGKTVLKGTGADLSGDALQVARQNGRALGIPAEWIQGDLFENLSGRYHMILSNPPYIPTGELAGLQEEVRRDPVMALDGKEDGLHFYRRIIRQAGDYLEPGGLLMFEIGCDQGEAVAGMMREQGYCKVSVKKDLAGLDRVVSGVYNN